MTKRIVISILLSAVTLMTFAQTTQLRSRFRNPEYEYGPWVFWSWMNGNVSKEGITLDLEAMNRIGISGAVLFTSNAGLPEGHLVYGSDEWFDYNKYMFNEAERLNMKVMLHNGPGYSITGAPWITPENSMQQIVWTETTVSDKVKHPIDLPQPYAKMGYYEDAAIIAYPSLPGEEKPMQSLLAKVVVNNQEVNKELLSDFNYDTFLELSIPTGKKNSELLLEFSEPFAASSIVLRRERTGPPHHPYDGPRDNPPVLQLESSDDGINFSFVARINMPALRELNAPASCNFNTVEARYYRITSNKETQLTELILYTAPRLEGWVSKANYIASANHTADSAEKEHSQRAFIDPTEVIDLTHLIDKSGKLHWSPPAGNWTILRIGHTTTGEENVAAPLGGKGLECDKLGKRGIDAHYQHFLKRVFDEFAPYCGKSFYGIGIDSWEAGTQNWTKGFEKEFERRNQYSLIPYLAALTGRIVGSTSATENVLVGIRQTQATMLAENFHQRLRDYCHQHDLCLLTEPYGDGPFNSLEIGKYIDIPAGEFWAHGIYGGSHTNNMAGYIARTNGRKVVASEAYTAMPDLSKFTEYPAAMKGEGDWMFCNGINRFMFHTYAHQPHPTAKPGMTMGPFGIHMNRNQTWWEQSLPYMDYLRRCQYMLQQGKFIANSSPWVPMDNTIDPTQKKDDFSYQSSNPNAVINYIHRKEDHTDFYFVCNNKRNPEQIIAIFDINGKQPEIWHPETGEQYPVYNYKTENNKTLIPLSLKDSESLFVVFEKEIDSPAITIISPEEVHSYPCQEATDNFTISVWLRPDVIAVPGRSFLLHPFSGETLYGEGQACIGMAVGQNGVKVYEQSKARAEQVLFAETRIEGWSLITLVYENGKPIVYVNGIKCAEGVKSPYTVHANQIELAPVDPMLFIFQGEYLQPELLPRILSVKEIKENYKKGKPVTDNSNGIYSYKGNKMIFDKNGTYTLLKAGKEEEVEISEVLKPISLSQGWDVHLPMAVGVSKSIRLKELTSLHLHPDKEVRYFSGTATYRKSVTLPADYLEKGRQLVLDLGNVAFLAEISINGTEVTNLWKAPYQCDITSFVKAGINTIEIKVTNLWTNRLIGDEYLPVENKYDKWGEPEQFPEWYVNNRPYSGKRHTFVAWKQYDKDGPLTESGLIGPIKIISLVEKNLE